MKFVANVYITSGIQPMLSVDTPIGTFKTIPNKPVYCKLCWEGIKNVVTVPN